MRSVDLYSNELFFAEFIKFCQCGVSLCSTFALNLENKYKHQNTQTNYYNYYISIFIKPWRGNNKNEFDLNVEVIVGLECLKMLNQIYITFL